MKHFAKLFAILAALMLLLCGCGGESGVMFTGDDNLDDDSFTGTFVGDFTVMTEPFTLMRTELDEPKSIHISGFAKLSASGISGPV